jgi:hypothetical protein
MNLIKSLNMKTTLLTVFLAIAVIINLIAQKVSLTDAEKAARNFFYERINQYEKVEFREIEISGSYETGTRDYVVYYVFNMKPKGFVMVSATLNAIPVPAYSFHSCYSETNQPPQFMAWVKQYYDQIQNAIINQAAPLPEATDEWDHLLTNNPENLKVLKSEKEVLPMLISNWDQGTFYNQLCPVDPGGPAGHCYTGCVATAMGQICYYFRFPSTGMGSYSYQLPNYGTISANFEDTEYMWNEMTNAVETQNVAVAELLFHLGVSVDMDYGPNGSGMWNHKAAYSLRTYFKYSPQTQYLYRDSTNLDWDSVIVAHLDQKIPMYYAGWSVPNVNGHAFVVDGYQTGEYFHFNWGWSGSYNGYFYLDNLVPGGSNFNLAQELIINCFPDTLSYTYPEYCTGDITLTNLNGSIDDGSGPTENYLNNTTCSWLISPQTMEDSVTNIIIEFDRFNTETDHDFVALYDGETTASPLIGEYSGSTLPETISSTGNKVLITFNSDGNETASGWFISYSSVIPVWCSGLTMLTAPSDTLSDGSGNFYYHNGSVCMWNIQPPGASELTINFLDFDTEENKDLVKIYNAGNSQLLATYSGIYEPDNLPEPVTSPSGKMMVTFSSNMTVNKQGWTAYYTINGVGINEDDNEEELIIYPNPAKDIIYIELNLTAIRNVELYLSDIKGTIVYSDYIRNLMGKEVTSVDVASFNKGIYFIKIVSENKVYFRKIVITD